MRKIILDCDPGHDDMLAMILAFASDDLEVLAITTSAGNQTQDKTNYNARKIMSFMGITGVPVARGCEKPLCRQLRIAADIHGETGLDGADLGAPTFENQPVHAVELMRQLIEASAEKVSIVVTGPMTNVGALLALYPHLAANIQCISFMGGSVYGGNTTPRAEFNILVDPEAARIVFHSGIPLVMSGLEVTHQAQMKHADIERVRAVGNRLGKAVAGLMDFFIQCATPPLFAPPGHEEGAHMHDLCAMAVLLAPDKFKTARFFGDVELGGEYTPGNTVIDVFNVLGKEPNVTVGFDVDNGWLLDTLLAAIAKFP